MIEQHAGTCSKWESNIYIIKYIHKLESLPDQRSAAWTETKVPPDNQHL